VTHRRLEQLGGGAGIVGVIAVVVGMLSPGTLAADATAEETQAFFLDHRTGVLTQAVLVGLGVLLFLLFLATLRNVLRRTETGTGELSAVMSGSVLIAFALLLIAVSTMAALAYRAAGEVDASVVRMTMDSAVLLFAFSGVPSAVFAASAGVLMRRSDAFPMWLPGLAWLAAVLNVLMPLAVFFTKGAWGPYGVTSFVPPLALFAFLVASGVSLVIHPEAGEATAPVRAVPKVA
jgi:hypothetical protein